MAEATGIRYCTAPSYFFLFSSFPNSKPFHGRIIKTPRELSDLYIFFNSCSLPGVALGRPFFSLTIRYIALGLSHFVNRKCKFDEFQRQVMRTKAAV